MYTVLIGILAGLVAAWAMGDSPKWWRVVPASLLGFLAGAAADVAFPYVTQMPARLVDHFVAVPLIGHYGLSSDGLFAIPLGVLGAAIAALRNYNRIRSPNDLRLKT